MRPGTPALDWEYYFDRRDYALAAAAWVLELLSPDDATWVAATALQRGDDTQTIRVVAGLFFPTRREDGEKVDKMFKELGVDMPTPGTALRLFVPSLLIRIRDGDDSAFSAVMQEVWDLSVAVWEGAFEERGPYWAKLREAMYEWDHLRDLILEYPEERFFRARAKLISDTRLWAGDVLAAPGLSREMSVGRRT